MAGSESPSRTIARQRRSNVPGGRAHGHRVKVTEEESRELARRAALQQVSVPRLLVEAALSDTGETPTQRRQAMGELFAIRRALVNTANNLNQIAHRANVEGRISDEVSDAVADLQRRLIAIDTAIDALSSS